LNAYGCCRQPVGVLQEEPSSLLLSGHVNGCLRRDAANLVLNTPAVICQASRMNSEAFLFQWDEGPNFAGFDQIMSIKAVRPLRCATEFPDGWYARC
jgi:hypothetical protein